MAKRIIWSKRAKEDRSSILRYWLNRNKSNAYPRKLNKLFSESVRWLSESPFGRRRTDYLETYVKIVRDYKIIFEEDETTIFILTIWDTRQNPEKLSSIFEESEKPN